MTDHLAASALKENSRLLVADILAKNPMNKRLMNIALQELSPAEAALLEDYVEYCLAQGRTIDYLADSYLVHTLSTLREQVYFQKHKRYRHASFADVANDVYFNDEFMSHYMYGLALALFFWPNHIDMYRFFERTLPRGRHGKYLEIGPGHGFLMNTAMDRTDYDSFLGVDISETSVAQTKALLGHFRRARPDRAFSVECADFLAADLPEAGFDAIVMGEVLEHVEQPELFMRRIRDLAKDDAYIYITTCIDAAVIDHIYLFETTQQIKQLFNEAGLAIAEELFLPYEGTTMEESQAKRLPISVAYVLKKII